MIRNVGFKKWSVLALVVGSLSYGSPHTESDTSKTGSKTVADKSPKLSKLITELTRLESTNKNTIRLKKMNREKGEDFTEKAIFPPDVRKFKAFVEEAKNYIDGMITCGGKGDGDNHAFEIADLVEKCVVNQLGDSFIANISDPEISNWKLRSGTSQDPVQFFESTIAQCRQSLGDVMAKRKEAKLKDLSADEALLKKFDEVMTLTGFSVEELKKRDPGAKQKEIIEAAEAASKSVTEKSCTVPKLTDKKDSKAKKSKSSSEDEEKDSKDEEKEKNEPSEKEKEDPPPLKPVPRGGPTDSSANGGNPPNNANPNPQPQVPGTGFPAVNPGLNGGFDPSQLGNQFAGLDPTALLDAVQRPDGTRIGGSPSRTQGAPSLQFSPPQGGQGNQGQGPQQPEQPQPQQAQQGMMPPMGPQQAPVFIGDPNGSKKEETPARTTTPPPAPAKEDLGQAERKGFNDGYAQAMNALRGGMGAGMMGGMQAGANTGQRLSAGSRGGMSARRGNARNARRAGGSRAVPFAGTGTGVTGRRSPSQFGRGSMQ